MRKVFYLLLIIFSSCKQYEIILNQRDKNDLLIRALDHGNELVITNYNNIEKEIAQFTDSWHPEKSSENVFYLQDTDNCNNIDNLVYLDLTVDLFKLLRDAYIGYGFFGGDSVFQNIFTEIIAEIESESVPYNENNSYELMLIDRLKFIKDRHFFINYHPVMKSENVYYLDAFFHPVNNKYIVQIDSKYYELVESPGNSKYLEKLTPTILEDGNIAWLCLVDSDMNSPVDLTMKHPFGEKPVSIPVKIAYDNALYNKTELIYDDFIDGIKYFYISVSPVPGLPISDTFSAIAGKIKKEDLCIIDLQNNVGGSDSLFQEWFSGISGNYSKYPFIGTLKYDQEEQNYKFYLMYNEEQLQTISKQKSNTIIFVLQSRNTGSAGECLVTGLRMMENTIVVGQNTAGAINFAPMYSYKIETKDISIDVKFAQAKIYPLFEISEGIGLKPDFFIPTGSSLDRVVSFIKRYGAENIRKALDSLK